MNASVQSSGGAQGRGSHLVTADRPLAGAGALSRLINRLPATAYHRLIDRLDAAFDAGAMEGSLPDGTTRFIGGRGPGPVAHIAIHRWSALARLMLAGSVGWFQAWMDGDWSSDDPVAVFAAFSANRRSLADAGRARGPMRWLGKLRHALRRNDRSGAARNIHAHYDLGNDFYAAWLDPSMTYSAAIFDGPDEGLEAAQVRKMDAVLDRLQLKPGNRLLEIGCGWGALGARAIERCDVDYLGLTLSPAQADVARLRVPEGTVAVRDYRDQTGTFDAIVSVEMVEAVGQAYWREYLVAVDRLLAPGGRAAIQFIAIDDAIFDAYAANADFIQTYVFPGGCLLSEPRFRALAEGLGLRWTERRDFSEDYARTLAMWRAAYDDALANDALPPDFGQDFHRLWRYYLMYCEGGFRGGGITVAQVTLTKADRV